MNPQPTITLKVGRMSMVWDGVEAEASELQPSVVLSKWWATGMEERRFLLHAYELTSPERRFVEDLPGHKVEVVIFVPSQPDRESACILYRCLAVSYGPGTFSYQHSYALRLVVEPVLVDSPA